MHAAVLLWLGRPARRAAVALVAGVLLGAPALLLAAATLLRDWGAREVARAYPTLAWGQHTPLQMLEGMARFAVEAFGGPFLALLAVAALIGVCRRRVEVVTSVLGTAATIAGIALLAPIARVQAYYAIAVLPLACLPLAALDDPAAPRRRAAWVVTMALVAAFVVVPRLGDARGLYLADADAFMPRFTALIAERPERTVVTVAHYDKTLLEYYLARREGRSIAWGTVNQSPNKQLTSLVLVHALDAGSEGQALSRLEQLRAGEPVLVIERDAFLLPRVAEALSACEPLLQAPTARLVRCPPP